MTVADCADYCRTKFPKNPPARKDAVIRSIKTAFNFKADVSDEFAEKIYQKMKNKKWELSVLWSVHFLFIEEEFYIKYNKSRNMRNLQGLL